jgi:hypothetical protein
VRSAIRHGGSWDYSIKSEAGRCGIGFFDALPVKGIATAYSGVQILRRDRPTPYLSGEIYSFAALPRIG